MNIELKESWERASLRELDEQNEQLEDLSTLKADRH